MRTDPRKACANEDEKLLWALVHDGIAHPLMALTLFSKWSIAFHDWTSTKAWPRPSSNILSGVVQRTNDRDFALGLSRAMKERGVPHVTRSIPVNGYFVYEVERLLL